MKHCIKLLAIWVIGMIFSAIVGVVDVVTLAFALINKGLRAACLWIVRRVGDFEDAYESCKGFVWYTENYAYKYFIDKLYPTEEDEP